MSSTVDEQRYGRARASATAVSAIPAYTGSRWNRSRYPTLTWIVIAGSQPNAAAAASVHHVPAAPRRQPRAASPGDRHPGRHQHAAEAGPVVRDEREQPRAGHVEMVGRGAEEDEVARHEHPVEAHERNHRPADDEAGAERDHEQLPVQGPPPYRLRPSGATRNEGGTGRRIAMYQMGSRIAVSRVCKARRTPRRGSTPGWGSRPGRTRAARAGPSPSRPACRGRSRRRASRSRPCCRPA